jgi:hypothetical protein
LRSAMQAARHSAGVAFDEGAGSVIVAFPLSVSAGATPPARPRVTTHRDAMPKHCRRRIRGSAQKLEPIRTLPDANGRPRPSQTVSAWLERRNPPPALSRSLDAARDTPPAPAGATRSRLHASCPRIRVSTADGRATIVLAQRTSSRSNALCDRGLSGKLACRGEVPSMLMHRQKALGAGGRALWLRRRPLLWTASWRITVPSGGSGGL